MNLRLKEHTVQVEMGTWRSEEVQAELKKRAGGYGVLGEADLPKI
jgi:hypothetical protein